jgi:tetratricopeptide (TPR) repeat protein
VFRLYANCSRNSQWNKALQSVGKNVKRTAMEHIVKKKLYRKLKERHKRQLSFRVKGKLVKKDTITRWMKSERHKIDENGLYTPPTSACELLFRRLITITEIHLATPPGIEALTDSESDSSSLTPLDLEDSSMLEENSRIGLSYSPTSPPIDVAPSTGSTHSTLEASPYDQITPIEDDLAPSIHHSSTFWSFESTSGKSPRNIATLNRRPFPSSQTSHSQSNHYPPQSQTQLVIYGPAMYKPDVEPIGAELRNSDCESYQRQIIPRKSHLWRQDLDTIDLHVHRGVQLIAEGIYNAAESQLKEAVKRSRQHYGLNDDRTMSAMMKLGSATVYRGLFKPAEALFLMVFNFRKQKFGLVHPETLSSLLALSLALFNQGKVEESAKLRFHVMQRRTEILGEEHLDTLESSNRFAAIELKQGRFKQAEVRCQKLVEIYERVLLGDHTELLNCKSNQASALWGQRENEKAESLERYVIEKYALIYKEDHPEVLIRKQNLAATYFDLGRLEEAADIWEQVMKSQKTKLGGKHLDTLGSMNNVVMAWTQLNRLKEAEEMGRPLLETCEKELGETHEETLRSIDNYAHVLYSQGQLVEAIKLMESCVKRSEVALGTAHPDTLESSEDLILWRRQLTVNAEPIPSRGQKIVQVHFCSDQSI